MDKQPSRIQLAKKAARIGGISVERMVKFAKKSLVDDDIRALDLKGEGILSARKRTRVRGPDVHNVTARWKLAVKDRGLDTNEYKPMSHCGLQNQLRPKKSRRSDGRGGREYVSREN